jgi:vancomycin permeability regulator SanA
MPAAVVFGAGLWRDGTRRMCCRPVDTAAVLYFSGKCKILMSGDNPLIQRTRCRRSYTRWGSEAIVLIMPAGAHDACYRAKAIFGIQMRY